MNVTAIKDHMVFAIILYYKTVIPYLFFIKTPRFRNGEYE